MLETTTVATPRWQRAAMWAGLPAAGAGLLLLLDRAADWIVRLPFAPLRIPFRLVQELPEPQATIGALTLGALAGAVLAMLADAESMTVRISGTDIVLHRPGTTRTVPRADVAVAFRDRDRLVLLGRTGRELAREPSHLPARRLRPLFAAHGVAWSDTDPYADSYRRWIKESPEVPPAAHAVFAARQEAIRTGDERDVTELRDELARLGFVVRDDRKRQYWRRVDG